MLREWGGGIDQKEKKEVLMDMDNSVVIAKREGGGR